MSLFRCVWLSTAVGLFLFCLVWHIGRSAHETWHDSVFNWWARRTNAADLLGRVDYMNITLCIAAVFVLLGLIVQLRSFVKEQRTQRQAWTTTMIAVACMFSLITAYKYFFSALDIPDWPQINGIMGAVTGPLYISLAVFCVLLFALAWFPAAGTVPVNIARLVPVGIASYLYYFVFVAGLFGEMAAYFFGATYPSYLLEEHLPRWLLTGNFSWDYPPQPPQMILAYLLLATGAAIVVVGFAQILKARNKRLVTDGLYATVRQPQNLGITVAAFGGALLCAVQYSPVGFIAWFSVVYLFLAVATYEEDGLAKRFGEEYVAYRERTPFLIPFVKTRRSLPRGWRRLILFVAVYVAGVGLVYLTLWILLCQILSWSG